MYWAAMGFLLKDYRRTLLQPTEETKLEQISTLQHVKDPMPKQVDVP